MKRPTIGGSAGESASRAVGRARIEPFVAVAIFAAAAASVPTGPTLSAQTLGDQSSISPQPPVAAGSPAGIRAGHILVRFQAPPGQDVLDQLNAGFGARAVGTIAGIAVTHLQAPSERALALLRHLKSRPDVEFAEFDSVAQVLFVPNDPYYDSPYASSHYGSVSQWGLPAVSAPAAWDATLGDAAIVIAVVDTGVDCLHPDLNAKCAGQQSFVGTVRDGFGHGTHVAGIAAASTNRSETLRSALQYAVAHNALPVCAMGNSGSSSNTPEPAYWYDCLSVIATQQNGARASFSNYGIKADVAAPGVAYLSTMPTFACTLTTTYGYYQNYDALSGTSMATPVMSGIAGLVLSKNPSLSPAQVKGLLMASAGDGVDWSADLAFGVANAATAVSAASHTDLIAPSPNLVTPGEGSTVSGLVAVQAAPTDDSSTVHQVDIVKDGTRFMQVLTGSSGGKGKGGATPWTLSWPSTSLFNGSAAVSAIAIDVFGNTSAPQSRSFSIVNQLVSQSWTAHVCWPSTPSCPNITPWLPVTTGVATEAATHLQGSVTYTFQQFIRISDFWVEVSSPGSAYYCGTDGTSVDCYPTVTLLPDPGRGRYSNYAGAQIDGISQKANAKEEADVHWTLTYPQ